MKSRNVLVQLRRYESRNVTFLASDGSWPIVWSKASGSWVWDVEGKRYLDLTGAFGVAAAGHANPHVVRAGQRQMERLLHAMGDVHPHPLKAQLARELSRVTFERWTRIAKATQRLSGKTIFCNAGFEAVEAALKTARLATNKPKVIAFEGAYHGLGYGALNATHREYFRGPFRNQLADIGVFLPFPVATSGAGSVEDERRKGGILRALEKQLNRVLRSGETGAILVEPIQARGGIRVPAPGFLRLLRRCADQHRALLVVDEIYTGFGRTGAMFACEHEEVVPDLICLGKALTGGFPLSACVGKAALMDAAWPESPGEALHTSTFLGHPVGCAMALAQIREVRRLRLPQHARRLEPAVLKGLRRAAQACRNLRAEVRCVGLMAGIELTHANGTPAGAEALTIIKQLLHRGFIFLPEGPLGEVISLTPPLIIPSAEISRAIRALQEELARY